MPSRPTEAAAGPPGALARPDWRPGEELTAAGLSLGQKYRLQRLRRHLRFVHGWGIVCGLNVVSAGDAASPWNLILCPGYGIGPCGDEIVVPQQFRFNLRDYLWTMPAGETLGQVWIALEAGEIPTALAPVPPCGCGCGDPSYQPTRMRDGFRIALYWTPPATRPVLFDLCTGGTPSCPACPEECGLIVARIALPQTPDSLLLNSAIDNLNLQGK